MFLIWKIWKRIPFTGVKIEKGRNFLYVLNELEKIKDISNDSKTKNDLNNAYNLLKYGIDNHNLDNCFESHKIIHDYDYWDINYPVILKIEPVDWGGVNTYFGNIWFNNLEIKNLWEYLKMYNI